MNRAGLLKYLLIAVGGLVVVNLLASMFYVRWDLTEDKRFTLSEPALATLDKLENPISIDVLLDGDLPAEFVRLQREARLLLEEFQSEHEDLGFTFLDPREDQANPDAVVEQLIQLGMKPANVTTEDNGRVSQEMVFPWAVVTHGERSEIVPLLRNRQGATLEDRITHSIQNMEFAFADAFAKLGVTEKKRVAVLRGNGEYDDRYLSDFLTTLRAYYNIAPFTLDSVATDPEQTLRQLQQFDAALIARPTEPFSEVEKLVLDQFMVSGGKTLWLTDGASMELDSLLAGGGEALAIANDLNLSDLLFRYGVRINPDMVADLFCSQIVLATGEGREAQYNPLPWIYHPLLLSSNNHPINTNLEALRMQFASSIDTVGSRYDKTVLYRTSPRSRTEGVPKLVSLNILDREPDPQQFQPGGFPVAVLVEGSFNSAYANRIRPIELRGFQENGPENKLIVISDGSLIANQLNQGRPLELGYDKWTGSFYGNKEFLINSFNYLLDDQGLLDLRRKEVDIPLLDPEKTAENKMRWQLLNIGLPLLLLLGIGLTFNALRKRRYS
ncbi:gliding-associated putative ABC transporter substrate-binding component GldG [Robiginitalea myxolifaciens]|uniref:Gliding-associated putative ABC transporter substrate-binding component GldG n=1 Tax=Robiginitalea myxolifaciens TaxID=400055 RepID=A0A1I6H1F9_9FLAO|nr:gliding motility-associated ABC transporter substrate-binding protein GldG [Robiginitalea myxolifaciens]SFR48305.1 gliding-associated putative ABC transporter substrate-binding component GldG [Robiginitalea myxolifaciens]